MKTLFVTPYPPKPDGIGQHTSELVEALGRIDCMDVEVLTTRRPVPDVPTARVHRTLTVDPWSVRRAERLIGARRPDILHYQFAIPAFGLSALSAFAAGARARRADPEVRIVITMHEVRRELDLLGPVGPHIYRSLVDLADGLIVHSADAHEAVVWECGADPRRVWEMSLGAAPPPTGSLAPATVAAVQERFGLTGHRPGGRPLVLCFGYLHRDKGIEDLIAAVAALRYRREAPPGGLDVLIAGRVRPRTGAFRWFERHDHEYERVLRRAVEDNGLEDDVRFVGFVASADVPALFAAARVVVVPYTKVTQSSVLGAATVAGVPVIATDLPGLREPVGDGGLLVPPADPVALATALARILSDDALVATLREHQKRLGAETELDVVAAELVDVYHEVIVAPPRSQDWGPVGAR